MDSSTTVYDLHVSVRPQEQSYEPVVYLGLSDTDPVFVPFLLLLPSVHSSHQSAESYVTSHVQYHVWKEKERKKRSELFKSHYNFFTKLTYHF